MFKAIIAYLDKQQWNYQFLGENKNIVTFGVGSSNGKFHCILDVDEEEHKLIFFSIHPINVSKAIRPVLAEFIIRLNYVLFFGNYEMNYDNGEIRFKTSFIYEDANLTEKVLDHIIKGNILTMHKHFKLYSSIIDGEISMGEGIDVIKSMQIMDRDTI